jgi:hypothetical protein
MAWLGLRLVTNFKYNVFIKTFTYDWFKNINDM